MHQMTKTQALQEIKRQLDCGLISESGAAHRRRRIEDISRGSSYGAPISWAQRRRLYAINAA